MDTRELERCDYEVRQAQRLQTASKSSRTTLYGEVYSDYAGRYPEALAAFDPAGSGTARRLALVRPLLHEDDVVVEIGPGRGDLAYAIAPLVREVIGVDVTSAIVEPTSPANFRLALSEGGTIPLEDESADLVISFELIEHLHSDDAAEHVQEVFRVLKPGGSYVCGTPNIICGPHDCGNVSPLLPCPIVNGVYITNGLHLKEYSNHSLASLFFRAGFSRVTVYTGARGHYVPVPLWIMERLEAACRFIPLRFRTRSRLFLALLGLRMRAIK